MPSDSSPLCMAREALCTRMSRDDALRMIVSGPLIAELDDFALSLWYTKPGFADSSRA